MNSSVWLPPECEAVYRSEKVARHGRFEVLSPKMCIWFSAQVTSQATRE